MSCRVARVSAAVYLVIREGQLVLRGTPRQKWVVSQDVLVEYVSRRVMRIQDLSMCGVYFSGAKQNEAEKKREERPSQKSLA